MTVIDMPINCSLVMQIFFTPSFLSLKLYIPVANNFYFNFLNTDKVSVFYILLQ